MKNKENKKVLSNTEVYSKLNPGDIFYGINDTGYAMYRLYDFQWGDGENRVWLGKDNSILYLITENNEKFIWGKEAFLSEEDAKNQLKTFNRSGNTYFDKITAELDRQEANAKNMHHHCCCEKGSEKPMSNLFSNSSAINILSNMVVEKFDADNQDLILIEEMSELAKELFKARRGEGNADEIREEMCHVLTSIEVVRKLMGISLEEINAEVEKKLKEYGKDKI